MVQRFHSPSSTLHSVSSLHCLLHMHCHLAPASCSRVLRMRTREIINRLRSTCMQVTADARTPCGLNTYACTHTHVQCTPANMHASCCSTNGLHRCKSFMIMPLKVKSRSTRKSRHTKAMYMHPQITSLACGTLPALRTEHVSNQHASL